MTIAVDAPEFGPMLRTWRERRRFSQQELSNRSAVSTRHLSRVETGQAHPTPEMILRLADHLEIPLRDRNHLLLAAGYAPRYSDESLDAESVGVVMDGLRQLLDAHEPYPALLLDAHWDIVDANGAVDPLLAGCSPDLLTAPINVVRLCLHPDGLAPRIVNLEEWAGHLHHQVVQRAERTRDPLLQALATETAAYVDERSGRPVTGPVLTLRLREGTGEVSFFTTTAQLTTAADVALEDLHLETFLPADAATRQAFG